MILVDTSIIIQVIRGEDNQKVALFKEVIAQGIPYGISTYTFMEVLQGARSGKDFQKLYDYLSTQRIYRLPESIDIFSDAAKMYFDLRRSGITPRGTIDVLIAKTAIHYSLSLLHNDKDYDHMASVVRGLKLYGGISYSV